MIKSDSIANLAAALSRVQAKLNGAVKESANPFFKSKYANLESLWESIRAPMAEEGLSVSQMPGMLATGQPTLITMLIHKSGEFISSEQALFPGKQDPQGVAAATTYARRSALSAIIGQVEVDDDGEAAMNRDLEMSGSLVVSNPQSKPIAQPKAPFRGMSETMGPGLVTEAQLKRLFAISQKHGVTKEQIDAHIASIGLKSTKDLKRDSYDALVAKIEAKK